MVNEGDLVLFDNKHRIVVDKEIVVFIILS